MLVYRISSPKYIEDLSGAGSKQYGARWNDKGVAMVYFAESRAMAVMEVLVHLRPEDIDKDFILAEFEISDDSILTINISDLPESWKEESEVETLKEIGNKFIKENKFLIMKVPSVIIEEDYNLVFNPNHPHSNKIKLIEKRIFKFDVRFKN
ncbi:RES family NAD+ phosphorylase [Pedobacter cryotolerans]|uniref:RES domain-containing protein n=1 Tax=Pedobacter cryotolerans TaxID=2571270 RepID=A0A4U1BZL9_9SPHI|nr:RES family NAD+ phosphorylase [Pedobacter cryotolerans]TKB98272.1 RES domain-containing protein [Pedobacter cryotolerans]